MPTVVTAELLCSARIHVVEPDVGVTPVEPVVVVPLVPVVVPEVDVELRLLPVDAAALVTAEGFAGNSSTMKVSIRVEHPKDVSAPNPPSQ